MAVAVVVQPIKWPQLLFLAMFTAISELGDALSSIIDFIFIAMNSELRGEFVGVSKGFGELTDDVA